MIGPCMARGISHNHQQNGFLGLLIFGKIVKRLEKIAVLRESSYDSRGRHGKARQSVRHHNRGS